MKGGRVAQRIPLEGWLLIVPCLIGLAVCAVHGLTVWRERRQLKRENRRPFPVVRGEAVMPDGVLDLDLSSLDLPPKPGPIESTFNDLDLALGPSLEAEPKRASETFH